MQSLVYFDPLVVVVEGDFEFLRSQAMFEVITSEASYLKSLTVVVSNFLGSRELAMTLHAMERHTLFSNLLEVRDVSERYSTLMRERSVHPLMNCPYL